MRTRLARLLRSAAARLSPQEVRVRLVCDPERLREYLEHARKAL